MPGQHGQTYDPTEEPAPRGGWFGFVERPYPERLDRALKWTSAALAVLIATSGTGAVLYAVATTRDASGIIPAAFLIGGASALAYGFTRGIGMILVALYGAARDGPEFVVDWRALRHDLRLRRTRVVLLEAALLLAAMAGMVWGMALFVREGSAYGGAMFALLNGLCFWPFIRRWMLTGRAD